MNDDTICVPNAGRAVVPVLMNRLGFKRNVSLESCLQFGLAGLKLLSCSILPPDEDQYVFPPPRHLFLTCLFMGEEQEREFPRLSRALGANSMLPPNLSAVLIGWPSAAFLLHCSAKGRPGMSDWGWGALFQGEQSRGCLQPVVTQPV